MSPRRSTARAAQRSRTRGTGASIVLCGGAGSACDVGGRSTSAEASVRAAASARLRGKQSAEPSASPLGSAGPAAMNPSKLATDVQDAVSSARPCHPRAATSRASGARMLVSASSATTPSTRQARCLPRAPSYTRDALCAARALPMNASARSPKPRPWAPACAAARSPPPTSRTSTPDARSAGRSASRTRRRSDVGRISPRRAHPRQRRTQGSRARCTGEPARAGCRSVEPVEAAGARQPHRSAPR